jgi:DNA-binding CsgD family transcriptional regulator
MAIRDPRDLFVRTQGFQQDFLRYHTEYGQPWFIKDQHLRYVTVSRSFRILYGLPEFYPIAGKTDQDLSFPTVLVPEQHALFEQDVLLNRNAFDTLEINYFNTSYQLTPYRCRRAPFVSDDGVYGVHGLFSRQDGNFVKFFLLNQLDIMCNGLASEPARVVDVLSNVKDIPPTAILTDKEWEIVWLILNGLSHAEIAVLMDVSVIYTKKRSRDAYTKLKVFYQDIFIHVGQCLSWEEYFPERFIQGPGSIIINHCI